jgi:LPXTG-motif cell wall-anchored protein
MTEQARAAAINEYIASGTIPYSQQKESEISLNSSDGTTYIISNIEPGYYLIKDKAGTQDNKEGGFYTLYVTKAVSGTLSFTPKGTTPTPTKSVTNATNATDNKTYDTTNGQVNTASIGDILNYSIKGTVSSAIENYNTYYYKFTDTLSKGLSLYYAEGASKYGVKVEYYADAESTTTPVNVTDYFGVSSAPGADGTTVLTVAIKDLKALKNLPSINSMTGNSYLVLTYQAQLNEDAVVSGGVTKNDAGAVTATTVGNKNSVYLTYSNNPNASGTPTTDEPEKPTTPPDPDPNSPSVDKSKESTTNTYTMQLDITKIDATDANKKLDGAMFRLTGNGVNQLLVTEDVYYEATEEGVAQAVEDGVIKESAKDTYLTDHTERWYKLSAGNYVNTPDKTGVAYDESANKTKGYIRITTSKIETKTSTTNAEGFTDSDGVVKFAGLGAGEYKLTEVIAPTGYEKRADITFTLAFDSTNNEFYIVSSDANNAFIKDHAAVNGVFSVNITNTTAQSLPRTGGIGTTIFYVVGTLLVLGAGIALVVRRRMRKSTGEI